MLTSLLKVCRVRHWNTLQWCHNGRDSVSNHQPHDCLLNRLFRRRSKKTSKLRVNGLCARNSPWPVNSPHKWPVTRKLFPFDDVIMENVVLMMKFASVAVLEAVICQLLAPVINILSIWRYFLFSYWHIEAETKWPLFCRRHNSPFSGMKIVFLINVSLEYVSIALIDNKSVDNGLLPNGR